MRFGDFKNSIINNYKEVFPNSACTVTLGALGGDTAFVTYYLAGEQSEFPNSIAQNDLFNIQFFIKQGIDRNEDGPRLTDDSELVEPLLLEVDHKSIKTAPEKQYLAYGSVSLPFRKTTGSADKIILTLKKYAEVTKITLEDLYKSDKLPINQQKNVVDLVKNKLGLTESVEVVGEINPNPSIGKSYAYRLKHGIGPGTLPKDVKIKKYVDLNNFWTVVYIDRPLSQEELDYYDIPSETRKIPDVDKFIDYNVMSDDNTTLKDENRKLQEEDGDFDMNEDDITVNSNDEFQDLLDDMKNKSSFHKFVVEDLLEDCEGYKGDTLKEKFLNRCDEVLEHGCVSGTVGSLIYYSDTVKAYDEYADDIYDLIDDFGPDEFLDTLKNHVNTTEIILNCDSAKNWIVWMAYEDVVYQLYNTIE